MTAESSRSTPFPIALISMPWSLFNRPSLQLAALKAYVEREMSSMKITLCHPYLDVARAIGIDNYRRISENAWAGEALFAALLFPDRREQTARVFRQSLRSRGDRRPILDFDQLVALLDTTCRDWLDRASFQDCRLIGFSVCFNQLLSSLYIAALLKERDCSQQIVFGGSSCTGVIGTSLLQRFPQMDFVVDGEGEGPLLGLCSFLAGITPSLPDRVNSRNNLPAVSCPEIADLGTLPTPDYHPYFSEIRRLFPEQPFIPVLPLEFSRGCWWNKCSFCNLNSQWQGYRCKKAGQMTAEVERLSKTHQCLDFTFSDNALPVREADQFFQNQAESAVDCRFFAEIRGTADPGRLQIYSRGGLRCMQVGIEALSTSLLVKMAKGTTAMENIAVMKYSAACAIRLEGNLILEFPGSTEAEVQETLAALESVLPFAPLSPAVFFLGHGSPVHERPAKFGIRNIVPHNKNRLLFPPGLLRELAMPSMDYRGDRSHQHLLWRPVAKKIRHWRQFHAERQQNTGPPLSYRDGDSFLIIRQERPNGPTQQHRFRGLSRQIYLFCGQIRTTSEIREQFGALTPSSLEGFLSELADMHLLFRENERVLALAIQRRP